MSRSSRWSALLGLLSVVAAGVWAAARAPIAESISLADTLIVLDAWPVRTGIWQIDHFGDAPMGLLLARAFSIDTADGLLRLGAVATTVAIGLLAAWAAFASAARRWHAARLALLGPVVAVLFFWLGFYDAFTVLAWGLVLFAWLAGRPWLLAVSAIPLGFQHFEQGLLGLIALTLTWLALRDRVPPRLTRTTPAWAVLGVLAGKALLIAVLMANGQSIDARGQWLEEYLDDWTKAAIVAAPILVWSLFAGLWPLVVATWLRSSPQRQRWLLLLAFAVGVAASAVAGDRPRVFVLAMLPSLLVAIVAYASDGQVPRTERTLVEAVAWLAPPVLLMGGSVMNENVVDLTVPAVLHVLGLG